MILKRTMKLLKEYLNKIKDYFNNEINERKDIIKKLNKYIVSFDCLDKYLLLCQHYLVL